MKVLKWILKLGLLGFGLGVIAIVALYFYVKPELPSVAELRDVQWQTPMQVYSADGELISQFGEMRRIPLTIDAIPQQLKNAFLATEDTRFYSHFGIDPIGVGRAFFLLISTGEIQGGGSTITQQLARNFYLSYEQTWARKIKEAFIALHIEQMLSKDEIFELYLNKISFGHRAFGVGAAAQVYYGKTVDQLTLAEIAIIAGLPKAPSTMNPISYPERARDRRAVVLGRMLDENFITQQEYQQALQAPIRTRVHGAEVTMEAPYLAEMVRQEMIARFGEEDAYTGGYKVYTTANAKQQRAAIRALRANLHRYDERHGYRGPVAELWEAAEATDSVASTNAQDVDVQPLVATGVVAWDQNRIFEYLEEQPSIGELVPAVVTEVAAADAAEQSATVVMRTGEIKTLPWSAWSWARPFMNDERQGSAPETVRDVVAPGHHIWLRNDPELGWRLAQIPEPSSALVALRPQDGGIAAVVGGYSFALSQYNRALQAERQAGSNIKPFVYSAALDNGFTLASLVNDAPINQWNPGSGIAWRPRNSPDVYEGPIRVRQGLAKSKNVVSVRLLRAMGINTTVDHIAKFGFAPDTLPRNESISLGSASMTPLQVARGYAVFANGGYLVDPYVIERIEDEDGEVIYQAAPKVACSACEDGSRPFSQAPQVISEQNAFLVQQAMNSAIWGGGSWAHRTGWNGTAWRVTRSEPIVDKAGRNVYGKTGTTNDVKDTWFSGYVSGLVTTVWVGFDNLERTLGRSTMNANLNASQQTISGVEAGAKTALPAWIEFMEVALEDVPAEPTSVPPNITSARIDLATGKLSKRTDHTSRFEYFMVGTAPTDYADSTDTEDKVFEAEEGLF